MVGINKAFRIKGKLTRARADTIYNMALDDFMNSRPIRNIMLFKEDGHYYVAYLSADTGLIHRAKNVMLDRELISLIRRNRDREIRKSAAIETVYRVGNRRILEFLYAITGFN